MQRRTLLRNLALGVVAAPTTGMASIGVFNANRRALAVTPADLTPAGRYTQATAITTFVQGTVLSRDASGVLLVNRRGTQSVRLSPATSVWREADTTADAIASGDFLYVQGRRLDGNTVEALRIWANIGWYRGQVSAVAADRVRVFLGGGERTIYFSPVTLLFQRAQPSTHFSGQVVVGQRIEALGMFVPGGDMRATRVWVS